MTSAAPVFETVHLVAHGFSAACVPAAGGLIARLAWRAPDGETFELLHAPADARPSRVAPNRFGLWPLVPFANRAFGAVLDDGVTRLALPVNDPATGSCIHGFGWQAQWQMEQAGTDRAVFLHAGGTPCGTIRYESRLALTLAPALVTVTLAVTNTGHGPAPFGIGLHPWFACAADTRLRLAARRVADLGVGYRPTGVRPARPDEVFDGSRPFRRDTETAFSFIDWDGTARIDTPSSGLSLRLEADDILRHPVVWAPGRADFLCVEPQSHAIGAPSEGLVRAATPLARLGAGGTLEGAMRLKPSRLMSQDDA
jgi:aldose 1-epimerase